MSRLFGHGDLRLWLLKLIDDHPRHGYDIIAGLEDQFLGLYSPSPGTVYPRLQALEQEGLIEVEREEEGGRKVYKLTDKGREELASRTEELKELGDRLAKSAREIARDIKQDVKSAVQDLRRDVRRAADEVRRDERRASRAVRHATHNERTRTAQTVREMTREMKEVFRSLQEDLDGFVSDVLGAARRNGIDRDRMNDLRQALSDARAAVVQALEGDRSKGA